MSELLMSWCGDATMSCDRPVTQETDVTNQNVTEQYIYHTQSR